MGTFLWCHDSDDNTNNLFSTFRKTFYDFGNQLCVKIYNSENHFPNFKF